ncbi:MAG: hypothetical protein K8M05_16430 [Deltaproteobacteria bacterium]|nr:hypothetical protein [Kofleriaceae bacterium]
MRVALAAFVLGTAAAAALAGCGDDDSCGPGDAPADGITLTIDGETVTYGGFTASENNDCTVNGSGVISVSVHGTQVGGTSSLTLCLPRPDLLGADPVPLVPSRPTPMPDDRAMVIDSSAALAGGCTAQKDLTMMPSGTARFLGYCDGGTSAAGYALELAGIVPLVKTCGATMENVSGTLAGTVAVDVQ